ncbi:unnamed protein product [Ranitomeya imitator]|uniref:Uncharacterized protein n=1 Tax=Ranitomeya imitator TaxID=111125 RepID=A0ABN9KQA9_9NEOB|nr:unnamed protein product [Ranitomeya imitator]
MYATPLFFLTRKGQVHVQVQLTTGDDIATRSAFYLPLHIWVRLDFTVTKRKTDLIHSQNPEFTKKMSSVHTYFSSSVPVTTVIL